MLAEEYLETRRPPPFRAMTEMMIVPPVCPRLRRAEFMQEGGALSLRDPLGGSIVSLEIHEALVASQLDGERSAREIARVVSESLPVEVSEAQVLDLVGRLSSAGFLDDARGREEERSARDALMSNPIRSAAHAGAVYPADQAACRDFFESMLQDPSRGSGEPPAPPLALISPHIDYARGRSVYASLWSRAKEAAISADRVVIIGTSHAGGERPLVLTRKAFETPLGLLPLDTDLVDGLIAECGEPSVDDELIHRLEHSIELQLPFVQRILGQEEVPIVPILCGSIHSAVHQGDRPEGEDTIREAAEIARTVLGAAPGRTLWIAGVDLAHVGMHFGDGPEPLSDDDLEKVRDRDRVLLDGVLRGDSERLTDHLLEDGDARRICGYAPIWLLLQATGHPKGELVSYGCAVDPRRTQAVSFAGAMLYEKGSTTSE